MRLVLASSLSFSYTCTDQGVKVPGLGGGHCNRKSGRNTSAMATTRGPELFKTSQSQIFYLNSRTSLVNWSLQALRILSAEAGLSSRKGPLRPDSARAVLIASLMA